MPTTNANEPLRTADHDPKAFAQTLTPDAPFAPETGEAPSASAGQVSDTLQPNRAVQTGDGSPTASSELPTTTIPGYEILGELGRGGMGVVYKARHLKANRLVALKMVLSGTHAGRDELRRFQSEAEAVARLQHPHIVQVYDVGEHEGRPFFSLELCSGGSLEKKLSGTPLKAEEAAALVEQLARAMQAAHSEHVIHRDLKPANVLLAADGTPKITDFGLAKKLDEESGQTKSGAIMGTPSYMAPEQAEGKKTVGPLSDVYALGAILYDCLTGRPPFRAPTVMDTLLQVISAEPVRPRLFNARVPTDLETICLKCLHKEPTQRYASAEKLAEDLRRFQAGEPIEARPVGRLERGWRWCRRNAALAAALGAVAASLIVGTVVATAFAIQANANAATARDNEETAQQEKAAAVAARNELEQSNDRLLTSVARSLLRPLLKIQPNQQPPPLSDPEIGALWELASTREDRLRLRFVEEAMRDPETKRQLKDRAAVALHSVVGLDRTRRTQVKQLLGESLQAQGSTPEQQENVAVCLAHVAILDRPLAARTAATLSQAMSKTPDPNTLLSLAQGLAAVATRLEPKEAAQVCGQASATLSQAMSKTTEPYALANLSQGLSAVAARMEPKEAAVVCGQAADILTQAMNRTMAPHALLSLSQGLSAVAARLEPKEAAVVCGQAASILTLAMSKTADLYALQQLSQALSAVAARMEPKEPAAALTQTMSRIVDPNALVYLSERLSEVASRLEPKEAVVVHRQAAATLTLAMSKTTDLYGLLMLLERLSTVAACMEPKEAAATLTLAMSKTTDPAALLSLAQKVSAVAARLEPKEVAQVIGQAAAILTEVLSKTTNANALRSLSQGLSVVADRMEPREAALVCGRACTTLAQAISKKEPYTLYPLSEGLSALAARLEPKEAAAVCGQAAAILAQTISKTAEPYALLSLAQGLSVVAARMELKEATVVCGQVAATLTLAMSKTTAPSALQSLSQGLSAVAAWLEPKEAVVVCGQAVATLTLAIGKTIDPSALNFLSKGLSAVTARFEPREAAQVAATLTLAMSKTTDPSALTFLSQELPAVATRLESKEAAATLTQAMRKNLAVNALPPLAPLAQGLSVVAARMEPKEAAVVCGQAAATLIQAMSKTTDPSALLSLSWGLSAVAAYLEPREAAHAAATLIVVMSKTPDRSVLVSLSSVLAHDPGTRHRPLSVAATVAGLPGPGIPFAALASAQPALEPLPPPLPAQMLVELLKQPLCVGEPRRLVLEQLARHYHRSFADQWEFVEYAQNQKLGLDLTTPPQRPDIAATGPR